VFGLEEIMRRRVSLPIAVVVIFSGVVVAADQADVASRIDQAFAEYSAAGSPGVAVSVIRDGGVLFSKGYGMANLELEVPITPKNVFYLGSVSKQFVASAIVLLDQEGKLSLEDDIRKYVPEFPDYGTPIAIRHLIHHTSGIRDYLELMGLAGLPLGTFHDNQGIVDMLARQKALNFVPGEKFLYSNSGYLLLAVIVEKASGKSLREYAAEKIFEPLGMKNTHFHDDYMHLIPNRASGYFPGPDGTYRNFLSTFDRVGSGGVFSNVEDLYLWDQNFYSGKVGGEKFLARMHERGKLNSGEELDYAFGLAIDEHRGLRVVEHGGALGGYRTSLVRFPDERFSVIVLANLSSAEPGALAMQVADIFLADRYTESDDKQAGNGQEVEPPMAVEVSVEELGRVTGHYWNADSSYSRRIYVNDDGGLMYSRGEENETALAPQGDDRFRMLDVPMEVEVAFRRAGTGRATEMVVTIAGRDPVVMTAYEPVDATVAFLSGYAGRYHCEELSVDYEVAVIDGQLTARGPDGEVSTLTPGIKDVFTVDGAVAIFSRQGERVDGFVLDSGRVRGLKFDRE
jgi:CubicO group peptidase (beta-lactamase class C family)